MPLIPSPDKIAFPIDRQGTLVEIDGLPVGSVVDNIFYFNSPALGKYLKRVINGPIRAAECGVYTTNSGSVNTTNLNAALANAGISEILFNDPKGGTYQFAGTTTIPAGKVLRFSNNNVIDGAATFTFYEYFEAGKYPVFGPLITVVNKSAKIQNVRPEWFGAKADGITDDTVAVKKCFSFYNTYNPALGEALVIKLEGKYIFDPSTFTYQNTYTFTVEFTGTIYLQNEWKLPGTVNLIGKGGGSNGAVQFLKGNLASIFTGPLFPPTSKTVFNYSDKTFTTMLHLYGSGGTYTDFAIWYPPNVGIYVDGGDPTLSAYAASQKKFVNVGIQASSAATVANSIPVLVEHGFWIYFYDCAFLQDPNSTNYSIIYQNRYATLPPGKIDMGSTGLSYIQSTNMGGRGIFMGGAATTGYVGNIRINECLLDGYSGAYLTCDSTNARISHVYLNYIETADGTVNAGAYISNTGYKTDDIRINAFSWVGAPGSLVTGTTITNLYWSGEEVWDIYGMPKVQQKSAFRQSTFKNSEFDAILLNRGWEGKLNISPFAQALVVNPAANFSALGASVVVPTLSTGPDGTNTAYRYAPTGTGQVGWFYWSQTFTINPGDYIVVGLWIRPDAGNSITTPGSIYNYGPIAYTGDVLADNSTYIYPVQHRTIAINDGGWVFGVEVKKNVTGHAGNGNFYFNTQLLNGHPVTVWNPFVYIIPAAIPEDDVYAWAKTLTKGISYLPVGSYGMPDTGNIYFGANTRWNWGTGNLEYSVSNTWYPIIPPSTRAVTANTSVLLSDHTILANTATGAITVSFNPALAAGKVITVKKTSADTNTVIISPSTGTIDGSVSRNLALQWETMRIQSDGTNLYVI